MTLPSSNLSSNAINTELNFGANTNFQFNRRIVRQLIGVANKQTLGTPIAIAADLGGKYAFAGILGSGANAIAGFGGTSIPIIASANLAVNTSFFSPTIDWTFQVVGGSNTGLVTSVSGDGRSSFLTLTNPNNGSVRTANVLATATISIDGFVVGSQQVYANLTSEVYNSGLTVSGPATVNAYGYSPQSAVGTITATANSALPANASIQFVATRISGAVLTPFVTANTIIFQVDAQTPGITNTSTYQVTTNLILNGNVIQSNVRNITLNATYPNANFNLGSPPSVVAFSTTNANAILPVTATHQIQNATIIWSLEDQPGSNGVPTIVTSNSSFANVVLNRSLSLHGVGEHYSNFRVNAVLKDSANTTVNTAYVDVQMAAGVGTITLPASSSNVAQGYIAQTSITNVTASMVGSLPQAWFTLTNNRINGTTPIFTVNGNTATYTVASSVEGGNVVSNNIMTTVLTYRGQNVWSNTTTVNLNANYLVSSLALTGSGDSVIAADSGALNTLVSIGTTRVPANGTVTWALTSNNSLGGANTLTLQSNATHANVSIAVGGNGVAFGDSLLVGTLFAPTGEQLKTASLQIRLGVVSFGIQTSSSNVTSTGFASQTAISTVSVTGVTGNTTWQTIATNGVGTLNAANGQLSGTLTSSQATPGAATATRTIRVSLNRTVYGYALSAQRDISLQSVATFNNPAFSASFTSNVQSLFTTVSGTVSAQGSVVGSCNSSVISGGGSFDITYNLTSGTAATVSGTGNQRFFDKAITAYGTNTATYAATVSLYHNGTLIGQQGGSLTITTTKNNPALSVTAYDSFVSGQGDQTATAGVHNVSSNNSITSRSYEHVFTLVTGSAGSTASNVSTGSATVSVLALSGQTVTSTYDITTRVKSGSTILQETTNRVFLSAEAIAPLSVTCPSNLGGIFSCTGTTAQCPLNPTVTSNLITATASGGVGGYTYTWTQLSGDTMTATAPNSSETRFYANVGRNTSKTAVWQVTASSGGQTATDTVTVNLEYLYNNDL